MHITTRCIMVISLAVFAAVPVPATAQSDYPNQAIRVIVPFPPAGGTDMLSRLLTDQLRFNNKWTLTIDNKPGAGGNIGMDTLAKSKPDGYTLAMGQTANLAINPALYPDIPFNASQDFVPIALVAAQPMVLVVRADSPFKTLKDLITSAKAKPGILNMASAGNGTVGHLTGELFGKVAGIKAVHIPYKGAAPAVTDLLSGQVDFYFATPQTVVSLLVAGKLRALAVSSAKRLFALPEVPTIAELGFKGFEAFDWKALMAPAGTPVAIVNQLNAEVDKAMSKPEVIAKLLAEGSMPMSGSPQQVTRYVASEQQRWGALVRENKVKLD